jgi:tetratricopeptide (TPR) repeat protein
MRRSSRFLLLVPLLAGMLGPQDAAADGATCRAGAGEARIRACQEVVRQSPNDAAAWVALGDELVRLGRSRDAVNAFQSASRVLPQDRQLQQKLAAARSDAEEQVLFERRVDATRRGGDAEAVALEAIRCRRLSGTAAADACAKALAAQPRDVELHMARSAALREIGRAAEAADSYRRILAIDPGNAEAKQQLARLDADEDADTQLARLEILKDRGELGEKELEQRRRTLLQRLTGGIVSAAPGVTTRPNGKPPLPAFDLTR